MTPESYTDVFGPLDRFGPPAAEVAVLRAAAARDFIEAELSTAEPDSDEHTQLERALVAMDFGFRSTIDALTRGHWPFEVVADNDLEFEPRHAVRCVIIPSVPILSRAVFEQLSGWAAQGGFVVGIDPLPQPWWDDSGDEAAALVVFFRRSLNLVLPPVDDEVAFAELLDETLTTRLGRAFFLSGIGVEQLLVEQRANADAEAIILANPSEAPVVVVVELAATVPLELLDLTTDRRAPIVTEANGKRQRFEVRLEPQAKLAIVARR